MKLIVGLGNPGKQYERTRHNIGFAVLEVLRKILIADDVHVSNWELSKKFNAEICGGTKGAEKFVLAKPMTFMNDSGIATQLIAHFYKIAPSEIIVVHDDKDLPLGECRKQVNRGSAGHNGVRSIIERIGTQNFTRLRVGVANTQSQKADTAEFVLQKFGLLERKKATNVIEMAALEISKLI